MLYPLQFNPIYRQYLWGGRRFESAFGRMLPPGDRFAESWELVDHGADQSVVAHGPLRGTTLHDLVLFHAQELLGIHASQSCFPILFKFLDAACTLSVQVHPDDARAARLSPPDLGKTEAWVVLETNPGSLIYAGLRDGVDREALSDSLRRGKCEQVLHAIEPKIGDCIFIPAGTVHAIGEGLLVAEIQQASDTTYRLHDWNRVGPDGKSRPLHIDSGIEAVTQFGPVHKTQGHTTDDASVQRLVESDYFILDTVRPVASWRVGGDHRCHFLVVLEGQCCFDPQWDIASMVRGDCILIPACLDTQYLHCENPTTLLRVMLP